MPTADTTLSAAPAQQPRLDAALAAQAEGALSKIMAVLPAQARAAAESLAIFAPPVAMDDAARAHLQTLRIACESRRKLRLHYRDLKDVGSERIVRPLGCVCGGAVWTLAAWCEARAGFRSFRVDRIEGPVVLDESFAHEPGKTLADLFRHFQAEHD